MQEPSKSDLTKLVLMGWDVSQNINATTMGRDMIEIRVVATKPGYDGQFTDSKLVSKLSACQARFDEIQAMLSTIYQDLYQQALAAEIVRLSYL